MKKILPLFVIVILVISGLGAGAIQANNQKLELKNNRYITPFRAERAFTHTVLGEFGTATWCGYCPYAHGALKEIYAEAWYPFYYVTLVGDKNKNAYERLKDDYNLYGYPTVYFDGGYRVNVGAGSVEGAKATYNVSINDCGARSVNDIDLSLDVEWLGPVNPSPGDGATLVPIEKCLNWTNSEMKILVSIDNNEASTYEGTLRVYVNEVASSMGWDDLYGNPYTFPFLDYAYNEDISINAGQTWDDTKNWDGKDYNDGYGNDFSEITQENIMVIAAVFDDEAHQGYSYPPNEYPFDAYYVDESVGFLTGANTDPKTYDVYFGESNPPPLVSSNQSDMGYCVTGGLNFSTTYYWKIVVWDNQGFSISGPIWSFTTRGNSPPDTPSNPNPEDGETELPINTCISWTSIDPDGDEVTYDVYFGKYDPLEEPPLVSNNQSSNIYCPDDPLDFETKYAWKIVAWDEYGLSSIGAIWTFTTESNVPPNTPKNPDPPDGATDVSIEKILKWTGGDPNQGDKVTYDVYFGKSSPPPLVAEYVTQAAYDPGTMDLDTTYYWQIVAEDSQGETAIGPIWQFTTEKEINLPPTSPDIDGPNKGKAKVLLCWTFHSTDPNNNKIKYIINWGDEKFEETNYYQACTPVQVCHTYETKGIYFITAIAEDEKGLKSGESSFEVLIPRYRSAYNQLLQQFFKSFFYTFPKIRNLLGF